jgi:hypothetical protein
MTNILPTPRLTMRSALMGSALALPLLTATGAAAQDTENAADACAELQGVSGQIDYAAVDIAEEDVVAIVETGDAAECATYLTEVREITGIEGEVVETEQARVRLQDEVVIEGRVIIDQQPPNVQVEEQAAEVSVRRPGSDVTVNEGALDILVRQAAPTVTFEMPQPTITIDQPAPEIIVTMPDPTVDVANARPQIEVRQAEPRVSVNMPEPTVELDLYQAEDAENSPGIAVERAQRNADGTDAAPEAEVAVTRADAQILYLDEDESDAPANVSVNRSQPNIRFEQSEPQIEVATAPEPQVNWTQSGEPVITFNEQSSSEGAATQQASNDDAAMGNDEVADSAAASMAQEGAGPNVRRDGFQTVATADMTPDDLEGAMLFGVEGQEVRPIGDVTVAEGGEQEIIVDIGDFLGQEVRMVSIPMTDLTLLQAEDGDQLRAYVNATEEQLMSYPEVQQ